MRAALIGWQILSIGLEAHIAGLARDAVIRKAPGQTLFQIGKPATCQDLPYSFLVCLFYEDILSEFRSPNLFQPQKHADQRRLISGRPGQMLSVMPFGQV